MNDYDGDIKAIEPQGFNFGTALMFAQDGYKVARRGWNGKDMWISYTPGKVLDLKVTDIWTPNVKSVALKNNGKVEILPYLSMKTVDNKIVIGWLASQTDMLADDWFVVIEKELEKGDN